MTRYRFQRRAFLASIGGAFGLEILLRNLEASAAGTAPPPRFLLTHFPNGTVQQQFVPSGTGTSYVSSPILQPFEDAGLRADLIGIFGLNHRGLTTPGGGGSEAGTPFTTTGASSLGTRENGGERDDAVAGGPSWDQIFLKHVPELAQRDESGAIIGPGYVNAICDRRIDSNETSTQCLSYSHETRMIESGNPGGPIMEHRPLMPEPSPALLYATLFSGFVPGGSSATALKALRLRKSVLDSALRDLARLRELAPASERDKIDAHAAHIRALEARISRQIADDGSSCVLPEAPPETLVGKSGNAGLSMATASEADNTTHEAVGAAHLAIIRTAFQCDLVRVASFQWAPGTGHIALNGLDPNAPEAPYFYRVVSRRRLSQTFWAGPRPAGGAEATDYDIVTNANIWYSRRMASLLAQFKGATDVFGGNLLDHTIVPYVTEIGSPAMVRDPMPALVFGGRALGMIGGQFVRMSPSHHHNDLWATIAQAYFRTSDPLATPALQQEVFYKTDVAPLAGLWTRPA